MTYLVLTYLFDTMRTQRQRLTRSFRDDGYSTETILVAALLVVMAITVIGILASKIAAKANSINLDGTAP
jgi:uncharacterized membrane protein